ncbi:glycosylhydrolase-like jelly roll fold domain-containing protein [Paenibacillus puerhi]|uniref:glycosylhydrolase-like jelly roll fold domain-containing protein n=1 Tax=Paenibacillus puerhi TaxID=2692622 RepID=UPI001356B22F|nr:glycosylhydrolase-like jelly roll fold domain-containing protein [Paenibacillus puerhi]
MTKQTVEQQFLEPSEEFTPIPFWFWNDDLNEEELLRQIGDFADKGVMGFVIHPRLGIPESIPYLSDTFMQLVLTAVKEAAARGMKVILYDEAMYPSGSAKGMVVQGNPEYASRGLRLAEIAGTSAALSSILEEGEVLVSAQGIRRAPDGSVDVEQSLLLQPQQGVISLEQTGQEEGWSLLLLIETYSKGTIRGIHFGEDDGEPNVPASADLLNPEATDKFIRITHERYYEWLKDYFGETVIAMFTDEPEIMGRGHKKGLKAWTGGFLESFIAHGNREQDLPLLWLEGKDGSEAEVRKAYRKAIQTRMILSYYKPLSDWCAQHGIALTGHPAASDDIGLLEHFQIPGQDVVWRWVAPENELGLTGRHSTAGKCSSDAARHRGRRRNINEVLGVCGKNNDWNLSAGDMKWYLDWLFVRGVNMISPHAFYYSIDGPRRFNERPPDVGPNNIWWPHYKTIAQYIKRMSWLMTDSRNMTSIAVVCGEDWMPWRIAKPLYENQLEFNYLEEKLITPNGITSQGTLRIAEYDYSVLLVEEGEPLDQATEEMLRSFAERGGTVIRLAQESGTLPKAATHLITNPDELIAVLEPYARREIRLQPAHPDVRVSHVVKEGQHFIVAVNEGELPYKGSLIVKREGFVDRWDAWKGTIEPAFSSQVEGGIHVHIELEYRQSVIYRVDPERNPVYQAEPVYAKSQECLLLSEGWTTEAPHFPVSPPSLGSWTELPELAHISGSVTYRCSFEWNKPEASKLVTLDLGEVQEVAEVRINGQAAGAALWRPYRFDIQSYLEHGVNTLEITVTNSLANHFDKLQLPSGLIGPVKISTFG